jgi:hypothetical protein
VPSINVRRLTLAITAALAVGFGLVFARGVASAGVLGGVGYDEANKYCNERFGSRGAYNARPQDAFNAYSWGCFYVNINWSSGVDFNRACTIKYGSPAYAYSNNPSGCVADDAQRRRRRREPAGTDSGSPGQVWR